jgi:exosome complex RNA-binding protein Csl4
MASSKLVSKVDVIISAILGGNLSIDELRAINSAVRTAHRNVSVMATRNFETPDQVEFTSKNGRIYIGKVKKVNHKNILVTVYSYKDRANASSVNMFPTVYKVPAAMLRAA